MSEEHRPKNAPQSDGQSIQLGSEVGLYFDTHPSHAVAPGDWVATEAGSRYLVLHVRRGKARARHAQQVRLHLRVARLPKHTEPPADITTWWMTWYPRARSRS